ncbi:hypothetical protein [Enterobacter cloacae]|uniref:hypothetical protein n=1 Tax=Enterobacter cloacae TaxID=550 RepID=UPI002006B6AB|nr:hypothetical protein [Enterobacter cloacae]MCK7042667.1 hypothetical protein [Enterobacter cloacae]
MITFTKEQLIASAHARIEFAEMMLAGELEPLKERTWSIELELARIALASLEAEAVAWEWFYYKQWNVTNDPERAKDVADGGVEVFQLYRRAPAPVSVPDDYFSSLVAAARVRADKAMRKFPQPNYVLNKVAEESGEVIKAVIHFTEGREEWRNVEGEIIDNLAMLIRLVMEGDQVIGFTPPDACRAAMLQSFGNSEQLNSPVIPDGWKLVPIELTGDMTNAMSEAILDDLHNVDVWRSVLAAAPQQEVNNG